MSRPPVRFASISQFLFRFAAKLCQKRVLFLNDDAHALVVEADGRMGFATAPLTVPGLGTGVYGVLVFLFMAEGLPALNHLAEQYNQWLASQKSPDASN